MPDLELTFASGESSLDVRRFAIHEALNAPFQADVWARSPDPSLDLSSLVGKAASLRITAGYANAQNRPRVYSGLVSFMEQARSDTSQKGLSTYRVTIVPRIWLLSHRTNYRVYQHLSIPTIVEQLLDEWDIAPEWRIDRGAYPELEYKVQYEETDLVFVHRLLEEAGITLFFDDRSGESKLVLADQPQQGEPRAGAAITFVDNPSQAAEREFVTKVQLSHEVRHGSASVRDVDFRHPSFDLRQKAERSGPEAAYEHYVYRPGAFLVEPGEGGDTPFADDRGIARHDERFGKRLVERALLAERAGKEALLLGTNVIELSPGTVFATTGHPHPAVDGKALLASGLTIQGAYGEEWTTTVHALPASAPYVPPAVTPRPTVVGVQTATVVGPEDEEIHTDEFGRVRVQFPWDREGELDEESCCWVRVSEGWGGRTYGFITLPRIGHEVLVSFLEGDPDRPMVVGRVYNQTQPVPNKLPENKTQSDLKSNSSIKGEGFNQLKFEDKAGDELVYWQAQRDQRVLIKNDETHTVGHDRQKSVGHDETDTTDNDRFEVTRHDRSENTHNDRTTFIKGDLDKLVKNDERELVLGDRQTLVEQDVDIVIGARRRERVQQDSHLHVLGDRCEKIDGTQSLTVEEDQVEQVDGSHALAAGGEIHLASVHTAVGEAPDATLKGPGGFIRIDASGIHIVGNVVDINVSGSPGEGKGSKPKLPDEINRPSLDT